MSEHPEVKPKCKDKYNKPTFVRPAKRTYKPPYKAKKPCYICLLILFAIAMLIAAVATSYAYDINRNIDSKYEKVKDGLYVLKEKK